MSDRPATMLDLQIALSTILRFAEDTSLASCTTYLGFMRRADAVAYAERVLASSRKERKQAAGDEGHRPLRSEAKSATGITHPHSPYTPEPPKETT